MMGRLVFLGLLFICVAAAATEKSGYTRKPSCPQDDVPFCPLNLAPVCGSDGNTYPNECALCVERVATKMDILIVKEESCQTAPPGDVTARSQIMTENEK